MRTENVFRMSDAQLLEEAMDDQILKLSELYSHKQTLQLDLKIKRLHLLKEFLERAFDSEMIGD